MELVHLRDGEILIKQEIAEEEFENNDNDDDDCKWCICGGSIRSFKMVKCDNISCSIKWFHWECMHLRRQPKDKWYCKSCRKWPTMSCIGGESADDFAGEPPSKRQKISFRQSISTNIDYKLLYQDCRKEKDYWRSKYNNLYDKVKNVLNDNKH